jgi:hypothetical protein
LSGRVAKVVVTWPGPDGPSTFVSTGGTKEEVGMGCQRGEGGGDEVTGFMMTLRARVNRRDEGGGGEGVTEG